MRTRFADFDRLAIDGGNAVRTEAFPAWPVFDDEMLEAVQNVLKSGQVNYWTGRECREFEQEFADFVGTAHAVSVSNGTVALELALETLGIKAGDEVIIPPRTFVATASAVAMRGAVPVFADIDPVSGNICVEGIERVLTPRTRAIIVVHAAGWPCDMDPILELARRHDLRVIEDCAQAHGATYHGRKVGSLADIGAFSFCQDKIMTTGGEGGMVTMNSRELWERAWSFKDHGKNWDAVYNQDHSTVFKWLHESIGTNWRMNEIQGTIGRHALRRLRDWLDVRRRNSDFLNEALAEIPGIEVPIPQSGFGHAYYKYYAHIAADFLNDEWPRDRIVRSLQAEGIPCGSGMCCEIYLEKAIETAGFAPEQPLPVASDIGSRAIQFFVHPTIGQSDLEDVVAACRKVLRNVGRPAVGTTKAA